MDNLRLREAKMLAQGSPARNWQIWNQGLSDSGTYGPTAILWLYFSHQEVWKHENVLQAAERKAWVTKARTQGNFSSAILRALVHFTKLCLSLGAARGASASPRCSFLWGSEGCPCLRGDTSLAFVWSEAYAAPLSGTLGVRDSNGFIWCLKVPSFPTLKPDSASIYLWRLQSVGSQRVGHDWVTSISVLIWSEY